MLLESWISDNNSAIPDPIPPEIANREIRASGYAGVVNTSYTVGKIEAWIDGKQKFLMQHPLLWGARWAWNDGLWLVLIVRQKYHSISVMFVIDYPTYGGDPPYQNLTEYPAVYLFSSQLGAEIITREHFYYASFEPIGWTAFLNENQQIPNPYSLSSFGLNIPLKGVTKESIGAEIIINQVSSHHVRASYRHPNQAWWIESGTIRSLGYYPALQYVLNNYAQHPYVGGFVYHTALTEIESKSKAKRVSPYNDSFLEYAIPMIDAPCPIQISVDPALNVRGDDHFCLQYEDYNRLLNRFDNIESNLNLLPP